MFNKSAARKLLMTKGSDLLKQLKLRDLHQHIFNSSSIAEAAEKLKISNLELFGICSLIDVDYIELKILNENQLRQILSLEVYNGDLSEAKILDLSKIVLQLIHEKIKLNNNPPYFFSDDIFNQCFQLYLHQFVYDGKALTINEMQKSTFDFNRIFKQNFLNDKPYPSLAEIYFLISLSNSVSLEAAARFFDCSTKKLKSLIAETLFKNSPLIFNVLKTINYEETFSFGEVILCPLYQIRKKKTI